MMVVSVPVTMHLRRMSRLVPGSMAVIMRGSGPMRLRMMGVVAGVVTMRMAVTVHTLWVGCIVSVPMLISVLPITMSTMPVMGGSRSMGLRIMGMAVGVLIMRMAVPVHGVVRMSVIICRRLIGLTLLTHAQWHPCRCSGIERRHQWQQ
jgi:hypothetical protein